MSAFDPSVTPNAVILGPISGRARQPVPCDPRPPTPLARTWRQTIQPAASSMSSLSDASAGTRTGRVKQSRNWDGVALGPTSVVGVPRTDPSVQATGDLHGGATVRKRPLGDPRSNPATHHGSEPRPDRCVGYSPSDLAVALGGADTQPGHLPTVRHKMRSWVEDWR